MRQVHASDSGYCLTNIDHATSHQVADYLIEDTPASTCLMQGTVD